MINRNNIEGRRFLRSFGHFLREKFDLDDDKAAQPEVIENISKGVEFRGTNLWILIFATFVASLGLNVNSAAVIIGAMLISPLMGPIMGIGLSLGINNFELMKRSLRNFGFMVLVAIITATVFFLVSPLSTAQSELLARTQPTIYDVMIAFFGGLAGIVAQTRNDRTSTVIPGVAIATALMPPLCTAGFGLATGQWSYFAGATYLFFINTVFIALATYLMVRFLKYEKKVFLDKARERRVKHYMLAIILITIIPSVFMAYAIVQATVFENNADKFVKSVFNFKNTQVVAYERQYKTTGGDNSSIEVTLIGESLSQDMMDNARAQMPMYGLASADLIIHQSGSPQAIDISTMQKSYTQILDEKNKQITELQKQLGEYDDFILPYVDISREAAAVVDNIRHISLALQPVMDTAGKSVGTALVAVVEPLSKGVGIDM